MTIDHLGMNVNVPADNTPINQLPSHLRDIKRAFNGQLLQGATFEPGTELMDAVFYDPQSQTWRRSAATPGLMQVDGFAIPVANAVTVSVLVQGPWGFGQGEPIYLDPVRFGKLTTEASDFLVGRSLGAGLLIFAVGAALAKVEADRAIGEGKKAADAAERAENAATLAAKSAADVVNAGITAVDKINTIRELSLVELTTLRDETKAYMDTVSTATIAEVKRLGAEQITIVTDTGVLYKTLIEGTAEFARATVENAGQANINTMNSSAATFINQINKAGETQSTRISTVGNQTIRSLTDEGVLQRSLIQQTGASFGNTFQDLADLARTSADRAEAAAKIAVSIATIGPASKDSYGWVRAGKNVDVAVDGTISVEFDRLVSSPVITAETVVGIGYSYPITFSATPLVAGRTVKQFTMTIDGEPEQIVPATDNIGTTTWVPKVPAERSSKITVVAYDNLDYRSDSSMISCMRKAVTVVAPVIYSPGAEAVDVPIRPAVSLSEFAVVGIPDTASQTQVQISTVDTFATTVVDKTEAYKTAFLLAEALADNTVFFVRARHSGTKFGWSAWSAVSKFTTIAITIAKPSVITPVDGAASVGLVTAATISPIATTGINDSGLYTQVQLSDKAADWTTPVFDTGVAFAYATSVNLLQLLPNKTYYVRARHSGSTIGWSAWSEANRFATLVAGMVKPGVIAPTVGATEVSLTPTIMFSGAASSGISDTFTNTQVQVSADEFVTNLFDSGTTNPVVTSIVVSSGALTYNGTYKARVRHRGTLLGWSEWSDGREFKTIVAKVNAPTIIEPANNAIDISRVPLLQISAFSNLGPVDSPKNTRIQFARDAGFTQITFDSGETAGYATSYQVLEANILMILTRYYVRAKHNGTLFGWSDWGPVSNFITINQALQTPVIITPTNGAKDVAVNGLEIVISPAQVTNQTADLAEVQLSTAADFATITWQSGQVAVTDRFTVNTTLPIITGFYVRARYKGSATGWTPWSATSMFTTINAQVTAPSILTPAAGSTTNTLTPTFTFSPFANVGPTDTARNTQFQISTTNAFTSFLVDTTETGSYVTSYTTPQLPHGTTLYARVRNKGQLWGWSPWSDIRTFSTIAAYVEAPTIIKPDYHTTSNGKLYVEVSAFKSAGIADIHVKTEYRIALDSPANTIIYEKIIEDNSCRNYIELPYMPLSTSFILHVRHYGSLLGAGVFSDAFRMSIHNNLIMLNESGHIMRSNDCDNWDTSPKQLPIMSKDGKLFFNYINLGEQSLMISPERMLIASRINSQSNNDNVAIMSTTDMNNWSTHTYKYLDWKIVWTGKVFFTFSFNRIDSTNFEFRPATSIDGINWSIGNNIPIVVGGVSKICRGYATFVPFKDGIAGFTSVYTDSSKNTVITVAFISTDLINFTFKTGTITESLKGNMPSMHCIRGLLYYGGGENLGAASTNGLDYYPRTFSGLISEKCRLFGDSISTNVYYKNGMFYTWIFYTDPQVNHFTYEFKSSDGISFSLSKELPNRSWGEGTLIILGDTLVGYQPEYGQIEIFYNNTTYRPKIALSRSPWEMFTFKDSIIFMSRSKSYYKTKSLANGGDWYPRGINHIAGAPTNILEGFFSGASIGGKLYFPCNNRLFSTSDGYTWKNDALAVSEAYYIYLGSEALLTSTVIRGRSEGLNMQNIKPYTGWSPPNCRNYMTVAGGKFFSIDISGSGFYYSSDGLTWSSKQQDGFNFYPISYIAGTWVAYKGNSNLNYDMYVSSDLISWVPTGVKKLISGLSLINGYLYGFFRDTKPTTMYKSLNGLDWIEVSKSLTDMLVPTIHNAMIYVKGKYRVIGGWQNMPEGGIVCASSSDLQTWDYELLSGLNLHSGKSVSSLIKEL